MRTSSPHKPSPVDFKERCIKCGSTNLVVVRDSTWPSLECDDCGTFVRDFGD